MSETKIKVMSAGACEGPVHALAPEFTRACRREVELIFNTVGALKQRFLGGERPDVLILSAPAIDELDRAGEFVAGSRAELGRAICGVAVRDGMLPPDISTPDKFKRMLHFAGSIAANDPAHGGSSGIYLEGLLKRIGQYDEVKPKLVLCKTGREVAMTVARGHAEIGITFTSEFVPVPGTRVVGPLPKDYEYVNGYAGAIPIRAGERSERPARTPLNEPRRTLASLGGAAAAAVEPAREFLKFLAGPQGRACFQRFGLE